MFSEKVATTEEQLEIPCELPSFLRFIRSFYDAMTFLEERDLSDVPLIPEYYRGKTVFITGGSGFLGKILIEKLLYCCSELDRIYILLRSKKGVKPEERLDEIYKLACFDRLRSERPGLFHSKVFLISGDVGEPNLGISEDDRALLVSKTNIIFHSAASVRFDDSLKAATKLNLIGTQQILELAKDVHNLECFLHVSTAYSNKFRPQTEEKLYPPLMDWRKLLEICENDDHTVQVLTPKLLNGIPNTYILTKHLAEHMIYEEKGNLPIVIVKPSIVTNSLDEPVKGWTDNFNGPIGIIIALLTGLSSILFVHPHIKCDYIPVDIVVRSLICAAWIRGTKRFEPSDDIPIYNACSSGHLNFSPSDLINHGNSTTNTVPFECIVMPASMKVTSSRFIFDSYLFFTRVILYTLIDLLLRLFSMKPRLVKLIRRIYIANIALEAFTMNEWRFSIDNNMKLLSVLKEKDVKDFHYDIENVDHREYILQSLIGAKKFLLKEKMEDIHKAHVKKNRMKYCSLAFKILFFSLMVWYIYSSNITRTYVAKILN